MHKENLPETVRGHDGVGLALTRCKQVTQTPKLISMQLPAAETAHSWCVGMQIPAANGYKAKERIQQEQKYVAATGEWTTILGWTKIVVASCGIVGPVLTDMGSASAVLAEVQLAKTALGMDVVYNEEMLSTMNLQDFTESDYEAQDVALRTTSLEAVLESAAKPHRSKGLPESGIRAYLNKDSELEQVLDLLGQGAQCPMRKDFKPNGGKETSVGGSYLKYRRICNNAILELVRAGKAVAFSKDALEAEGVMDALHISPLVWAPKADDPHGRTCLHLSKRSTNFPSVNESADLKMCDTKYPERQLPGLPDLAEMAC